MEVGRSYSDKEVAEYAGVASFRNYHNYVNSKDTTLDLLECPISEDIIKAINITMSEGFNQNMIEKRKDKLLGFTDNYLIKVLSKEIM